MEDVVEKILNDHGKQDLPSDSCPVWKRHFFYFHMQINRRRIEEALKRHANDKVPKQYPFQTLPLQLGRNYFVGLKLPLLKIRDPFSNHEGKITTKIIEFVDDDSQDGDDDPLFIVISALKERRPENLEGC